VGFDNRRGFNDALLLASEFPNGSLFTAHTDTAGAERDNSHHRLPMRSERADIFFLETPAKALLRLTAPKARV
jgi:hypothetical protein